MVRKNKTHTFLLGFSLLLFQSPAQNLKDVDFHSPNATTLGLYGEVPVSLFTGTPQISIPIHEINEGQLKVPISLSYNPSSVRPNVHPGWVGLGWALNAGGIITRKVNGMPDELLWRERLCEFDSDPCSYWDSPSLSHYGFFYQYGRLDKSDWGTESNVKELARGIGWQNSDYKVGTLVDTEPDEFIFNFNGYTGKFYCDQKGNIKVVSDPAIKVEIDALQEIHYPEIYAQNMFLSSTTKIPAIYQYSEWKIKGFRITTPDGVKYEFGLWNRPYDRNVLTPPIEWSVDFFQEFYMGENWNTWYLVRIESPNSTESIDFTYQRGDPIASFGRAAALIDQYGERKSQGLFRIFGSTISASCHDQKELFTGQLISPIYLSKISTNKEEIILSNSISSEKKYNYLSILSYLYNYAYDNYSSNFSSTDLNLYDYRWYCSARMPILADMPEKPVTVHPAAINYFSGLGFLGRRDLPLFCDLGTCINEAEIIDFNKLKWRKLDKIEIKNKQTDETLKQVDLSYNNTSNQRLRLSSVQTVSGDNTDSIPPYRFKYEDYETNDYTQSSASLPEYNLYSTDHWGYYSGLKSSADLFYNNGWFSNAALSNYKSKRNTDPKYLYAGILTRMYYPTGGYTKYLYEPHQYTKKVVRNTTTGNFSIVSTSSTYAGGLRIKEIQNYSADNDLLKSKSYQYEMGILNGDTKYCFPNYKGRITTDADYTATKFATQSIIPFSSNSSGCHIGYSKVTEILPSSGKNVYYYQNFQNHNDIGGTVSLDENFIASIDPEKSPYSPFTSKSIERGKLKEVRTYCENEDTFTLVRKQKNIYEANRHRVGEYIPAVATKLLPVLGGYGIEGTSYKIYTYPYNLTQQEITTYDKNGDNPITAIKELDYNTLNLLSEQRITSSTNDEIYNQLKYPTDYLPSGTTITKTTYEKMVDNNMLSYPILSITQKAEKIVEASLNTYKDEGTSGYTNYYYYPSLDEYRTSLLYDGGFPLEHIVIKEPWYKPVILKDKSYTLKKDAPTPNTTLYSGNTINSTYWQEQASYDKYDEKGNLLQITTKEKQTTSYLWGYNKQYPIAKIENTNYNTIDNALSSTIKTQIENGTYNAEQLQATLSNLNNGNVKANTYTYKPLVGITSNITPDFNTTYYGYDNFNRLQYVKDLNRKLISKYDYYYVSQNESEYKRTAGIGEMTIGGGAIPFTVGGFKIYEEGGTSGENKIVSQTSQDEEVDEETYFKQVPIQKAKATITYYDDLGRPKQTVERKANPTMHDIVTPIEYDAAGREIRKYLPYTVANNEGDYVETALNDVLNYPTYSGEKPYTETVFDNSPLNRTIKQGSAGNHWQPGEKAFAEMAYKTNTNKVKSWTYNFDNNTFSLYDYQPQTLYLNETTNHNGESQSTTRECRNKQNKVILVEVITTVEDKTDTFATHYIHDDLNQLRAIVPPKATDVNDSTLCYYYAYNERGNMTKKHIPGQRGDVTLYYDTQDRLIGSIDPNKNRTYIKYDDFSRPIETGLIKKNDTVPLSKTFYDSYNKLTAHSYQLTTTKNQGRITGFRTKVLGGQWLETVNIYDRKGQLKKVYSQNYFGGTDITENNYDFTGKITKTIIAKNTPNLVPQNTRVELEYTYLHNGLLSEIKHKVNNNTQITLASYQYDDLGNLKTKKWHNNSQTINYEYHDIKQWLTKIDAQGKFIMNLAYNNTLNLTEITPQYNGNIAAVTWSNSNDTTYHYGYEYDGLNRLTAANYGQNSEYTFEFDTRYSYDKNGNMQTLKRYDTKGLLNDFDYEYKGSNQLRALTRKNLVAYVFRPGDTNFDGEIMPADILPLGVNFGDTIVKENEQNPRRNPGILMPNDTLYLRSQTEPDKYFADTDGDGVVNLSDTLPIHKNLGLEYDVALLYDKPFTYLYDANGNLIYDEYKQMYVYYNHLNLPDSIVFREKGKIINQYLADGTLLERREIDSEGKLLSKTNYEGLFQFRNDSLEYIFTDEGYVQNGRYHYVLADQTQSTRAIINEDGEVVQYNAFYPYGGLISNLSFNTEFYYTFGGKEKWNAFGAGVSDFHARMFFSSLDNPPFSWQLDPKAEAFYHLSPYGLFGGNPISFIDPDGMRYISINDLLSNYGYASKEQQLFPSKTLYQNGVKIIQAVDNLLDPTAPIGVSVAAEIYKGTVEVKDAIEKDISKANRKDVIKYYNNLTEIDKAITEKLDDVNRSIKTLRREEAESGNLGINREEISSKTKQRWDLEYEQISVQFEIEKITPILEEPVIVR